MKIVVNGTTHDVSSRTLAGALDELGYSKRVVATAVNGQFVAVEARSNAALTDGDRIEILSPMQGG